MQLDRWDVKAPPQTPFEKDLGKSYDFLVDNLRKLLNKGLLFSDNFNQYITTITTNATPGVQTAITHGLKKIPTGCLILEKNKAAHVYLGPSGKDATSYNLVSDVASVAVTVMIF